MTKRINLELDLPDEVAAELSNEDLTAKVKESLVLELLREHRISQGKAAELLCIHRSDLFPLMTKYQISVVALTPEELRDELNKPLP
jgi:DNA-binding NtrC family response regulator